MNTQRHITTLVALSAICLFCCNKAQKEETHAVFTTEDSLSDRYLDLHDSVLITWNIMIQDDNQKIRSMRNLIHELSITGQVNNEDLDHLSDRLDQLKSLRYTPETLNDTEVIEAYDFASNSLVNELSTAARAHPAFPHNKTLQQLVDDIHSADQRVAIYRQDYDEVVKLYNQFIESHPMVAQELGVNPSLTKKPLFQMTADKN